MKDLKYYWDKSKRMQATRKKLNYPWLPRIFYFIWLIISHRIMSATKWDGEVCNICGRPYKLWYNIPDKIWISIFNDTNGTVCMDCMDNILDKNGIWLDDIYCGWVGLSSRLKTTGQHNQTKGE